MLKALIVISGTVIASVVTALPVLSPDRLSSRVQDLPVSDVSGAPPVHKHDRLRLIDQDCLGSAKPTATCADIYGVAGAPMTLVIGRRVGDSTTVLVRVPLLRQVASR